MPRNAKAPAAPQWIIQGTELAYPVGEIHEVDVSQPYLHFDERHGGVVDLRYTAGFIEDFEKFKGVLLHRQPDSQYHAAFSLHGLNQTFTVSRVRRLPLSHFYMHFDRLANGTWRIAYGDGVIPELNPIEAIRLR